MKITDLTQQAAPARVMRKTKKRISIAPGGQVLMSSRMRAVAKEAGALKEGAKIGVFEDEQNGQFFLVINGPEGDMEAKKTTVENGALKPVYSAMLEQLFGVEEGKGFYLNAEEAEIENLPAEAVVFELALSEEEYNSRTAAEEGGEEEEA